MTADALRLAVGTLTVVPVPPPRGVDRRVAAGAMLLAPAVGAALGALAGGAAWAMSRWTEASSLLVAAVVVAALAGLTRAIHLDGLADTADGLGSARRGADALAVMRRSDIGPFGVVALVLVLLMQVTALAVVVDDGGVVFSLIAAGAVSRTALPWATRRSVPAARPDGLGAAVAASVPPGAAVAVVLVTALVFVGGAYLAHGPRAGTPVLLAVVGAGLVTHLLLRRCISRFGGVTGDVLGACVEVSLTAFLVVLALA